MINGHGDDIHNHNREIISNFSSNIYTHTDSLPLHKHLIDKIDTIHSYPEPDASSLAQLIAEKNNISCNNICVTNGATEAIYMIAQTHRNANSTILYPTFSEYGDACLLNNHTVGYSSSLNKIPLHTDLVWLCNPNNPTGSIIDKSVLKRFIAGHPYWLIVIDQSYAPFTHEPLFTIAEAVSFKNVILLHSMTKQYAIPGLRLGYITAHHDVIEAIAKYRMPWSVNKLAIEAGKFLLNSTAQTMDLTDYLAESKRLQNQLFSIHGLTVLPSEVHFFLCKLENRKAADLKAHLIDKYGILIRDASNFYGLDEHYFRIAAQSREENDMLVQAVKEWI